jgi:hypothetical protein
MWHKFTYDLFRERAHAESLHAYKWSTYACLTRPGMQYRGPIRSAVSSRELNNNNVQKCAPTSRFADPPGLRGRRARRARRCSSLAVAAARKLDERTAMGG